MRCLTALFLLLSSVGLFAQLNNQEAIAAFLETYNSQRASRDWAVTETLDVYFQIAENHTLVAFLGAGETRVDLNRDAADPMDEMFPLMVKNATVISTNATILFIDPAGSYHFGFTLLDEPMVPDLVDGYITLFQGSGIGKRSATE